MDQSQVAKVVGHHANWMQQNSTRLLIRNLEEQRTKLLEEAENFTIVDDMDTIKRKLIESKKIRDLISFIKDFSKWK